LKITETEVRYVADLANLSCSDEEVRRFARELDGILEHIDKLNELDTAGVEPMAQVLYAAEETATLRSDLPRPTLGTEAALANAPQKGAGYFKIPRVIDRQ
jgi:aspartyl-tRNA(Asn)/glutamyl-tRNA(Gln) amidotransferase subunit C